MGSTPPFLMRSSSSVPSSMMVRSAPKSVSKTLSKPSRRSAAASLPVTRVPMGMPNSSPSATRTAGAGCTTTCLVGIAPGRPKPPRVLSFSCSAPTGQAMMHWPQLMQADLAQLHDQSGLDDGVEAAADGADDADLLHIVRRRPRSGGTECTCWVRARWREKASSAGSSVLRALKASGLQRPVSLAQGLQFAVAGCGRRSGSSRVVVGKQQLQR